MGKRGPKKGAKYAPTISKEQARDALRQVVLKHMERMTQSQIAHAIGIGHLYTRDKAGKFTKVENAAEVDRLLLEGNEDRDYWIFTKDPSVQAYTDLMNRALDKPKEQEIDVTVKRVTDETDETLLARAAALLARAKA